MSWLYVFSAYKKILFSFPFKLKFFLQILAPKSHFRNFPARNSLQRPWSGISMRSAESNAGAIDIDSSVEFPIECDLHVPKRPWAFSQQSSSLIVSPPCSSPLFSPTFFLVPKAVANALETDGRWWGSVLLPFKAAIMQRIPIEWDWSWQEREYSFYCSSAEDDSTAMPPFYPPWAHEVAAFDLLN